MFVFASASRRGPKEADPRKVKATPAEGNTDALSDDEEDGEGDPDSDAATLKAREWDNWKDDHEKGIGNKMR